MQYCSVINNCVLQIHDSYIELADLLVRSDPLAAVDVYCR